MAKPPIRDRTKEGKFLCRANFISQQATSVGQENMELQAAAARTSQDVRQLSQTHAQLLGLFAYEGLSRAVVDPESLRAGCGLNPDEFIRAFSGVLSEFVDAMEPRDALEKMALEQLMVQHARVLALSRQASVNANVDIAKVLNEACDGASNSFRRLMTSFRDHRRPKVSGPSYSIGQANLAHQQVVQNLQIQEVQHAKFTGEQTRTGQLSQATVPSQPERFELPAGFRPATAALEEQHRAEDTGRKGSRKPQRAKARREIGSKRHAPNAEP